MTSRGPGRSHPLTTGILALIMPAFSPAINSRVSPRISVWSKPILVMAVRIGSQMLVLSSRPPNPTSIIAISTCCLRKYKNAKAVVISKKVGLRSMSGFSTSRRSISSTAGTICFRMSTISCSLLATPLIQNRWPRCSR